MLRASFFRTSTVPVIAVSSILYQHRAHASDFIPLNPESFLNLCENTYSRFKQNPFSSTPLLLQCDDKKPYGEVTQYSYENIAPKARSYQRIVMNPQKDTDKIFSIDVPWIRPAYHFSVVKDLNGDILLQGRIDNRCVMSGRPLCRIAYTPKWGPSQHYLFYSLQPSTNLSAPLSIQRFRKTEEAKNIEKQKAGVFKEGNQPRIDPEQILKRMAITRRTPDQNEVMGLRAVDEYQHCIDRYQKILYPPLQNMLQHSAKIMHLSTLEAKVKRQELVPEEVKEMAYRDRLLRTEWLHLLAFFSYPMNKEPQKPDNLGAARACINTRMILLEYLTRWFALNVPASKTSLNGRFDLLLDTNVIDEITLSSTISFKGAQCKLTQKIDALAIHPEHISGSDLAMAVTTVKMLLENASPLSKQTVKMDSSASVVRLGDAGFFRKTPLPTCELPTYRPIDPKTGTSK